MKICFGLFLIALSINSWAITDECREQLKSLMKTETEMYLFEKHSGLIDLFQINCDENEFGNNLINSGAMVFVHEAAHFEDLAWTNTNQIKTSFNLFTVNNVHVGDYQNSDALRTKKSH